MTYGVKFEAKHLNALVKSIQLEAALPPDASVMLTASLQSKTINLPVDFVERIRCAVKPAALEHLVRAKRYGLIHHSLPHILELRFRVLLQLQVLNIWQEKTLHDMLFLECAGSSILLHDYEQRNNPNKSPYHESNEEATAVEVTDILLNVLNLPLSDALQISLGQNNLKQLLKPLFRINFLN